MLLFSRVNGVAASLQGNRILILKHLEKIVMIPAGPFTFGSDADFLRFSRKGAAHECRNDAAGIRPAGAATERYRDGQCGRRRLIVWVDRAAQAEAEVERSEGEGEAQGRPVVGGAPSVRGTSREGAPAGVRVGGWSGGRLVCL